MSVNQLAFLMPVFGSVLVYYISPKRIRWMVLLILSLVFYRLLGADTFIYILVTAASLTAGTLFMQKKDDRLARRLKLHGDDWEPARKKAEKKAVKAEKKRILIGVIVINLGLLILLKYGDFFLENADSFLNLFGMNLDTRLELAAPLGISYYTLQSIGYALEVYKGKTKAEKNPLKVLLFVTWFPQMTQGPIGRWKELAPQLFAGAGFSFDDLAAGCQLMLWGLFKKAVIGDNLKALVDSIFSGYETVSGFTLFMGCIYMALQLYADFSGYTDLVRGIARLYGIRMGENFQRPYFARTFEDFWRRWHMSMSSWFRDYVFYPASLSKGAVRFTKFGQKHFSARVKKLFPVIYAMSIVWLCTGLWHDASWRYVFWGIGNGTILIVSLLLEPQFKWLKEKLHIPENAWWWKLFCMIRTFLIVSALKVFPGAENTAQSLAIIKKILFHFSPAVTWSSFFMETEWYTLVYVAVGLVLLLAVSLIQEKHGSVNAFLAEKPFAVRFALYFLVLGILVYMGNFRLGNSGGFEYAQF